MTPVWISDQRITDYVAAWVSTRIWGDARGFGNCRVMAVMEGDQLIAGVVAHNYDPDGGVIELSGASEDRRWLSRPVLQTMFGYCFGGAGCQLVVQRISDKDRVLVRIFKSFGYTLHHIPRLRGRYEGEYVCTFTKEKWENHRANRKSLKVSPEQGNIAA